MTSFALVALRVVSFQRENRPAADRIRFCCLPTVAFEADQLAIYSGAPWAKSVDFAENFFDPVSVRGRCEGKVFSGLRRQRAIAAFTRL